MLEEELPTESVVKGLAHAEEKPTRSRPVVQAGIHKLQRLVEELNAAPTLVDQTGEDCSDAAGTSFPIFLVKKSIF